MHAGYWIRSARNVVVGSIMSVCPCMIAAAVEGTAAAKATDERTLRVIEFVMSHQPELAEVLAHLERSKPTEFARAIEELDRSVQPLSMGKTKDPRLHEMELKAWQTRTRVELLGARWMASKAGSRKDREELERLLREAIAAELEIRAAQLAYRKERSMAWYDRQLSRLSTKRDELIAARMKALLD